MYFFRIFPAFFFYFLQKEIQLPLLIYLQSKARAIDCLEDLKENYPLYRVDAIYANQSESQRLKIYNDFRDGSIDILIATNVLSRGVDFPLLKTVINFDIPLDEKEYVHRIGRASRGGSIGGEAITFFTISDRPFLKTIANKIVGSGCQVPEFVLNLKPQQNTCKTKRIKKSKDKGFKPRRAPFQLPDTVKFK